MWKNKRLSLITKLRLNTSRCKIGTSFGSKDLRYLVIYTMWNIMHNIPEMLICISTTDTIDAAEMEQQD